MRQAQDAAVPSPAEAKTSAPAAPADQPALREKRPAQKVTSSTDCATWWRLYQESEACFGPYRVVGGGIKPEAFDHCNEIPSPELSCGPYRH